MGSEMLIGIKGSSNPPDVWWKTDTLHEYVVPQGVGDEIAPGVIVREVTKEHVVKLPQKQD